MGLSIGYSFVIDARAGQLAQREGPISVSKIESAEPVHENVRGGVV